VTFRNLGVGDYTVTPTQSGRMFSPASVLVRLTTDSRSLTFLRDVPPGISGVTVVTNDPGSSSGSTAGNNPDPYAVFGTSEISVKITGSNFVRGQAVFFGARALAASNVNFIDANTLFVKIVLNSPEILQQLVAQGNYGVYPI